MAYGRKRAYRKRGRGRRVGRRYKRGGRRAGKAMVSRTSPFTSKFYTKVRYVTTKTLNATLVTANNTLFVCNGLFDPDYTGTGHQPLGFDQIMGIYTNYYVYKSTCTVDYISGDNTVTNCGQIAGLTVSDNTAPVTTLDTVAEQPYTTYKSMSTGYGSRAVVRCNRTWRWKQFNAGQYNNEDNQGTNSTNPTAAQYFNIWVQTPGGNLDPNAVQCLVTLTYYVCFTEPRSLSQS